ncbi:MAG: divergent polysaccharide deacetylase family protein [Pseudomonadota bacterium]
MLLIGLAPWSGGWALEPAAMPAADPPLIAIIIDDVGDNLHNGLRVIDLPGPVAAAFLPHTRYARRLARLAHRRDKEVMLYLPMEAADGAATGPGSVTLAMTEQEFINIVEADLADIPHVTGINNHMGSLLTQQPGPMRWLMQAINRRGQLLFFVDSRTTAATVAQKVAAENGVPNLRRDVFLDNDPAPEAIAVQFKRLLGIARRRGSAVAIGHPHGTTLNFLEQHLPQLAGLGIRLVAVRTLLQQPARPGGYVHASTAEPASTAATPKTRILP